MSSLVPYIDGFRVISEAFVYKASENVLKLGYNDYYSKLFGF